MFTDDIIRRALAEDVGRGDITSEAVVPEDLTGIGRITAKESLVVAGLGVAGAVFAILDPSLKIRQPCSDGDEATPNQELLTVQGSYRSLLLGERLALNFLQYLSGIASETKAYVDRAGDDLKILDTRKTVPLLRHLAKYAVRVGGGQNHRTGLFDGVMIKDNHVEAAGGSVVEAIRKVKAAQPSKKVVCEIRKIDEMIPALEAGATWLMLDNMNDEEIRQCVEMNQGKAILEVSGGVTLNRIDSLKRLGIDYVSVGALTHSVRSRDISFDIQPL